MRKLKAKYTLGLIEKFYAQATTEEREQLKTDYEAGLFEIVV